MRNKFEKKRRPGGESPDRTHGRIMRSSMNIYEIMRTEGPSQEVEADFYERVGDDWVFFTGDQEVFRLPLAEVQAVVKIPNPPHADEEEPHPII